MSEARRCDRCHGFYDIENEQQDRETPYEFKGDYVNLHLWVARNGVRRDIESRWYDLCPKCMMELECWLTNKGKVLRDYLREAILEEEKE